MPLDLAEAPTLSRVALEPDMERALARSSKQLLHWKSQRNKLIREAHEQGAGVREIARATGLSHPAIIRILRLGSDLDADDKAALNEELAQQAAHRPARGTNVVRHHI